MEPAVYHRMAELEADHWWFVGRRRVLHPLLRRITGHRSSASILDAGCGTGGNLAFLARFGELSAFEFNADARRMAADRHVCPVAVGHLPDVVPDAPKQYDVITLLDVLEHLDDDTAALSALGARLTTDGAILITVPAMQALWSAHDEAHHHKRRYAKAQLRETIEAAGLRVESISHMNCFLFPLAAATILLKRLAGNRSANDAPINPALNRILLAVFGWERFLIDRNLLPFGLSLVAIARPSRASA